MDPSTKQGNPMHSIQITDMIKGYHNSAAQLGYHKKELYPCRTQKCNSSYLT